MFLVNLQMPSLTKKDAEFINWASKNEVEFIAHSFVRNNEDVMAVQKILDENNSPIKIIAKIEKKIKKVLIILNLFLILHME